jgi:mannose-6-phosphate isomerase-like protein (cupin superfamily)
MPSALMQQILDTRIARFNQLKPFSLAFVDSLLPEGRKKNVKVIGKGVVENPAMSPPIAEDHGFTLSYILVPPGGGAGLHSHKTAEIFVPITGTLTVLIGDDKEEVDVGPLDVISVPTGVMRGFRNKGITEITVLAMVGGYAGGGSVEWHKSVVDKAAKETGLSVDDKGNLIKLPHYREPVGIDGSAI